MGSDAHVSPNSGLASSSRAGPGRMRASQATPSTAAAMPRPPKRGVATACTRRGPGWSSAPARTASARTAGVSASVTAPEAAASSSEYAISDRSG